MSSFKNDIIDFSQFCKENQFFISIDKLETFFKYIESKQIESKEDKLKYLFLLIIITTKLQLFIKRDFYWLR